LSNHADMPVKKNLLIPMVCCWAWFVLLMTGCRERPTAPDAGTRNLPPPTADTPFLRRFTGTGVHGQPWEIVLWSWADGYVSGRWHDGKEIFELDGVLRVDHSTEMVAYRNWQEVAVFRASMAVPYSLSGEYRPSESVTPASFQLLEPSPSLGSGDWAGTWHLRETGGEGTLLTGHRYADSMDFALTVAREGHNGYLEGRAACSDTNAFFQTSAFDGQPCRLIFQLREGQRMEIRQEGHNFSCGFGAGAAAQGTYHR
jgi:hypothetical protein